MAKFQPKLDLSEIKRMWGGLSSLVQRTITAVILAPLFFWILYIGGAWFTLAIIAIAILSYGEWISLVQTIRLKPLEYGAYAFLALGLLLGAVTSFKIGLLILAIGFLYVTIVSHMFIDKGDRRAPPWLCFGVLYIGVPCLAILWLRHQGAALSPEKTWAPAALLFFQVWATDTGAYIAGRLVGGPKLAPSISPKKTWSGLMGGMFCSALVMGGCATAWGFTHANWYFAAGLILAVVAQGGDLFESYVKRRAGVKDSGHIVPGHGGILDRIDGLLMAAPVFFLFILRLL